MIDSLLVAACVTTSVALLASSLDRRRLVMETPGHSVEVAGDRRRTDRVDASAELPVFLDLVAAAAAGGMSGSLALASAARATDGPLADALGGAITEGTMEGELLPAVRRLGGSMGLPELVRLATAMERSASLGTPLADSVRSIASEHRRDRRRAAEQRARQAPVRMLFPLVFLVLPAFLLLTVVPMLMSTLGSLS